MRRYFGLILLAIRLPIITVQIFVEEGPSSFLHFAPAANLDRLAESFPAQMPPNPNTEAKGPASLPGFS
jgi:hypothetical protein